MIVASRQEPNEEFDDFFENEIVKEPSISAVAKSYKDTETALRYVMTAENDEE